jgi:hypothetical protein
VFSLTGHHSRHNWAFPICRGRSSPKGPTLAGAFLVGLLLIGCSDQGERYPVGFVHPSDKAMSHEQEIGFTSFRFNSNQGADSGGPFTPTDSEVSRQADHSADGGFECPIAHQVDTQPCGRCGMQRRLCYTESLGEKLIWGPWGECIGELPVDHGCDPGSTSAQPCGLCGTRRLICQQDCSWSAGACEQPLSAECLPGDHEFVEALSCRRGGRGRMCRPDCSFENFGECTDGPTKTACLPNIEVALPQDSAGQLLTELRRIDAYPTRNGLQIGSCPAGLGSVRARHDAIVLHNSSPIATVRVSVWTGPTALSPADLQTRMWSYRDNVACPVPDELWESCATRVVETCDEFTAGAPFACRAGWAGLVDERSGASGADNRIEIGPENSAVVIVAGRRPSDFGSYQLFVRTDEMG